MILVFGATGHVGRPLVDLLLGAGERVRAVTRDPASAVLPEAVDIRAGDLSSFETLPPLFEDVERVYLMFPIPGNPAQPAQLRRALAGVAVRQVVLLSSLSVESDIPGDLVGQHHREAEHALEDIDAGVTFLRPGTFMSNTLHWAEQIRHGDVVRGLNYRPAAVIDERDVAAVAGALLTGVAAAGQVLPLTGREKLGTADQVRILGEVVGRPLRFEPLGREEALAAVARSMPDADPAAVIESVTAETVPWAEPRPVVGDLLGRPPGDFRSWARDHADHFR